MDKLKNFSNILTTEQKAQAFDLMISGKANGMRLFNEMESILMPLPKIDLIAEMYKLACTEALEIVVGIEVS